MSFLYSIRNDVSLEEASHGIAEYQSEAGHVGRRADIATAQKANRVHVMHENQLLLCRLQNRWPRRGDDTKGKEEKKPKTWKLWFGAATYAIQVGIDAAVGVDDGQLATQLVDLADDGHVATDIAFEVRRGRAWGGLRIHYVCGFLRMADDEESTNSFNRKGALRG